MSRKPRDRNVSMVDNQERAMARLCTIMPMARAWRAAVNRIVAVQKGETLAPPAAAEISEPGS